MPLRDILVHLDATAPGRSRLALAADLARRHEAHLTGLFVVDIPLPVVAAGDGAGSAVLAELTQRTRADALAAAATVEAEFRERLRRDGLAGEWRLAEGSASRLVTLHARYADIAVLGQEDPESGPPGAGAIIEEALFSSGRPVLAVPYAGRFESLGRRVLIGWNASGQAARAVNDALPLIAAAETATVLVVNPRRGLDGHGEEPGADIARHLARHGVRVQVEHTASGELDEGDVLLNRAAELPADLLVMGAYGHCRLRELLLGGVTRTVLRQMTAPVLMAH